MRISVNPLRCPRDVLLTRITRRGKVYEKVHAAEVMDELQWSYEEHFRVSPPFLSIDANAFGPTDADLRRIATEIAERFGDMLIIRPEEGDD
jgi:deoxyadenosine/deoxycytidine kinase